MAEITGYVILQGTALQLQGLVKDKLAEGWKLFGGVAVAANKPAIAQIELTFVQAMVRYAGVAQPVAQQAAPPTTTEHAVPCPFCKSGIPVSQLQPGLNTCPNCARQFTVEQ